MFIISTIQLLSEKTDLGQIIKGIGPLGGETTDLLGCGGVYLLGDTLSKIIGFITVLSFLWFTFQMTLGAIQWIASGGDKAGVQNARERLTHSVIGLTISVAGIFIVILISNILGIQNLLSLPLVVRRLIPGGAGPC